MYIISYNYYIELNLIYSQADTDTAAGAEAPPPARAVSERNRASDGYIHLFIVIS